MRDWFMQYWLAALFGLVTGVLGTSIKFLWKRQSAFKAGILALLHDRIFSLYGDCKQKGYASVEDIRNLDYLYNPYHDLGGNGTGTELFNRIKAMPDTPAEKE